MVALKALSKDTINVTVASTRARCVFTLAPGAAAKNCN
jgi:hypothetical protein